MEDNRFVEKYKNIGLKNSEIKYASMVESMDHALGVVLKELENKDVLKNTIVVFMSDNGGLSAVAREGEKHNHNYPLKSGKGSIYEGGIRVPMIVYSPFHKTNIREIKKILFFSNFLFKKNLMMLRNKITRINWPAKSVQYSANLENLILIKIIKNIENIFKKLWLFFFKASPIIIKFINI